MAAAASGNAQLLHHFVVFLRHSIYHPPVLLHLSFTFFFFPTLSLSLFLPCFISFLHTVALLHFSSHSFSSYFRHSSESKLDNYYIAIVLAWTSRGNPSGASKSFIFLRHFYSFTGSPSSLGWESLSLSRVSLDALKHVGVREHLDGIKLPPFSIPRLYGRCKNYAENFCGTRKIFRFSPTARSALKKFCV